MIAGLKVELQWNFQGCHVRSEGGLQESWCRNNLWGNSTTECSLRYIISWPPQCSVHCALPPGWLTRTPSPCHREGCMVSVDMEMEPLRHRGNYTTLPPFPPTGHIVQWTQLCCTELHNLMGSELGRRNILSTSRASMLDLTLPICGASCPLQFPMEFLGTPSPEKKYLFTSIW